MNVNIIVTNSLKFLRLISPCLIIIIILEILFKLFWINPYAVVHQTPPFTRLNYSDIKIHATANGLYQGGGKIIYITDKYYSIIGAKNRKDWAVGGSTTECGLVPQGQRWPDLLKVPAFNFGVSGNSLREVYHNIKYLLATNNDKPNNIYVLEGINDLRAVLREGIEKYNLKEEISSVSFAYNYRFEAKILGRDVISSNFLSWAIYTYRNFIGRSYLEYYQKQYDKNKLLDEVSEDEFLEFKNTTFKLLIKEREAIIVEILHLLEKYNIKLVLLTQPHGYYTKKIDHDLRVNSVLNNKRLSLEHMATALDLLNLNTIEIANKHNIMLVNTAECLKSHDSKDMFYDGIHFTELGSKNFANCINNKFSN